MKSKSRFWRVDRYGEKTFLENEWLSHFWARTERGKASVFLYYVHAVCHVHMLLWGLKSLLYYKHKNVSYVIKIQQKIQFFFTRMFQTLGRTTAIFGVAMFNF